MIWTVLQIRISCNQDINFSAPAFAGADFFVHAVLFTSLPYLFDKMFTNANYADKEKKGWNTQWKKIKVLVVDDESRMRKLVSDFFDKRRL